MNTPKRVLICEFHQETNTFNPIPMGPEGFAAVRYACVQKAYGLCRTLPCAFHGMMDAPEENDAQVIPSVSLRHHGRPGDGRCAGTAVPKGFPNDIEKTAVIRIGNMDIMVCEAPTASGGPRLPRHFGIEPTLYDLIVVKANTSFKVPYSKFADEIYYSDTPGADASNLKLFDWKHLPNRLYSFDLPADYEPEKAKIWR